jgi:hypothetical protein
MNAVNGKMLVVAALLLTARAAVMAVVPACAADDKQPSRFIRLDVGPDKQAVALRTAIVSYASSKDKRSGPTVDLVAAIHVADAAYYERLNREFQSYDAVLYELVTAEKTKPPKRGDPPSNHPLSMLQNGMKNFLKLEHQLGHIDYAQKNMVHADMTPEEFARSMQARGENAWTMLARMAGYAMAQQNQVGGGQEAGQLLSALFDKDRALALKRVLAKQFAESDDLLASMEGPNGSTLIAGRNQTALKVLRKELDAGKQKLAIFYGAAHMGDFAKRLHDDFGLSPVETRWITAWDLQGGARKDGDPLGK